MNKGLIAGIVLLCSTPFVCAQEDPARAFDFWVGDWEVSWYAKDSTLVKGTNQIEKILDGKVLQEHFEDPTTGYKGTSLSVYNPRAGSWYQSWADNQGSYIHLKGNTDNGQRIFSTVEPAPDGAFYRMVFSEIEDNQLIWTWESTTDDGKSWNTAWQIFYRRK